MPSQNDLLEPAEAAFRSMLDRQATCIALGVHPELVVDDPPRFWREMRVAVVRIEQRITRLEQLAEALRLNQRRLEDADDNNQD